jgi:hypothetical protein
MAGQREQSESDWAFLRSFANSLTGQRNIAHQKQNASLGNKPEEGILDPRFRR